MRARSSWLKLFTVVVVALSFQTSQAGSGLVCRDYWCGYWRFAACPWNSAAECFCNYPQSCVNGATGKPYCIGRASSDREWDSCSNNPYCFAASQRPAEIPDNGIDDNGDGCIDEGPADLDPQHPGRCTCMRTCTNPDCNKPQRAECPKPTPSPDMCGGDDDNCNGKLNEGCQKDPDDCSAAAGNDPILISSQAAVTEPFTDFRTKAVSELSITRTYNSNDAQYGVRAGIFGRGWHHEWEGRLTCGNTACTVTRGLAPGLMFTVSGSYTSLSGGETWTIYQAFQPSGGYATHHNVLAKRPGGLWTVFMTDGSELDFATVCDSCSGGTDVTCLAPEQGGAARLIAVRDPVGNGVQLGYDRSTGLLLGLYDGLGHALEVRGQTCADLASSLQYDANVVALYDNADGLLHGVTDAAGAPLRTYAYDGLGWGLLLAVGNEAGVAIAEFRYDDQGRATGLVDQASTVEVRYDSPNGIAVTEYYRGPSGNTSSTSIRTLDNERHVTSVSEGCACGSAKQRQWTNGKPTCDMDATGHVIVQAFDSLGRLTRRTAFPGSSCTVPAPLPTDSSDVQYGYTYTTAGTSALQKPIAQGISLSLEHVLVTSRVSKLWAPYKSEETTDYRQAAGPYDSAGYKCASAALPEGSVVCRSIQSGYTVVSGSTQKRTDITLFSYDAHGRLVQTLGPYQLNVVGVAKPREERTYWPDSETLVRRGRLKEVKRYPSATASPLVTTYDYDAFGVASILAPNGGVTTISKDVRGRPRFIDAPDGRREVRYYDGTEPRIQVSPGGMVTRLTHGALGRVAKVERLSADPELPGATPSIIWTERREYDAAGNLAHSELVDGVTGQILRQDDKAYDVQHRVVWQAHPEYSGAGKQWVYDPSGFLTRIVDEVGRQTEFTPDGVNRTRKVRRTGPEGSALDVATYTFDKYGSTASVVDGDSRSTLYAYDDFDRLVKLTSPDVPGGAITYTHDARGNILTRATGTDTIAYTYDDLDRLRTVTANGVLQYTLAYDEQPAYRGRLTSETAGTRKTTFQYDAAGRKTAEILAEGAAPTLVTRFTYRTDGLLDRIDYPTGLSVQYERDSATRAVVAVTDTLSGAVFADSLEHDGAGALLAGQLGNGLVLGRTYNLRGEPLAVTSGPLSLVHTPGPAGDIDQVAAGDVSRTFSYDFLDRLIGSNDGLVYGYDGAGNQTSSTREGSPKAYVYATGTDRVIEVRAPDLTGTRQFAFGYDGRGNLSAVASYDATGQTVVHALCLVHDPLGRLISVGSTATAGMAPDARVCSKASEVTELTANYRYDASNRRLARIDPAIGNWTYTISDESGRPLSELTLTATGWVPVRDYVWLDEFPLAQIERSGAPATYWYHVDHLGLPRALSSASGATVWKASTNPYGEMTETSVPDASSGRTVVTNLRLPGQYDERLFQAAGIDLQGPYYNWNRWYVPGLGRYLEPDPIAIGGGFNGEFEPDWYGYAAQNPARWSDSTGLFAGGDDVVGGVIIGIAYLGYWLGCEAFPEWCPPPLAPPPSKPKPPPLMQCHGGQGSPQAPAPQPAAPPPGAPYPGWHPQHGPAPGGNCPPCIGPELPPRIDTSHSHYPCPGAHVHYSVWEQDPKTCICRSKQDRIACL